MDNTKQPVVLILGPTRAAVSGVSTHLNALFGSALERHFRMVHFQVGSAGRNETPFGWLMRLLASPFYLAATILRLDPAIVHVNTSLDARAYWRDLVYVLVAKLFGVRVLYQVHGGALHAFCGSHLVLSPLTRLVVRTALKWPDVVVVISQIELQAMREVSPATRIVLLPNGTDCAPLLSLERIASDAQAPLRLLYIGRLVRTKGLFEILEALKLLRRAGVATRLVIAGSGPIEEALRQSARVLGLEDSVTFAGAAFGEHKVRLLADAEVLLLPTYHLEGLPYALLEGMAAGLVPIVTRVGAIPDVVEQDVHGVFVAPRDPEALARAIQSLAADRALRERMAAASRQRVATSYSVERLASDFTALYRVLAGPWQASQAG
jgi:glycosyltransferase involved in cell wall biosynthesis